jgi:hypothetical protein
MIHSIVPIGGSLSIHRFWAFMATLPWNPPPIQWNGGGSINFGRLYGGITSTKPHSLISCWLKATAFVLRQLGWWVLRPPLEVAIKLWQPRLDQPAPHLPLVLSLQACWLNAFSPDEVRTWMACGVSEWSQLKKWVPLIHSGAVHQHRRAHWPEQCRPASRLLANKAALLELADPCWSVPNLILESGRAEFALGGDDDAWWLEALHGPGLIIKPLQGYGCRGVVHFQSTHGQLQSNILFRKQADRSTVQLHIQAPGELFQHWQCLIQSKESAIAMPYLQASPALPPTSPTAVVRVITKQDFPNAPITVRCAWLELPLSEGTLALVTLNGTVLPSPDPIRSSVEEAELLAWQTLLADPPALIKLCVSHSTVMHQRLPPIDQVAWDWIPAAKGPILLEGNSGFSLLEPQLITRISG